MDKSTNYAPLAQKVGLTPLAQGAAKQARKADPVRPSGREAGNRMIAGSGERRKGERQQARKPDPVRPSGREAGNRMIAGPGERRKGAAKQARSYRAGRNGSGSITDPFLRTSK